jgi:hypothetical protein
MSVVNKNSTNKDLYEFFTPELLGDGKTRIFSMAPTANDGYKTIFLCQEVKASTGADSAQKFFLGWKDTRLVRAIHNADSKIAGTFKIGQEVPFDILIEEKVEPAFEGQEPKINPTSGEVVMFNDMRVYEHGSLVALGKGGIKRLQDQRAAVITVAEQPVAANVTKAVEA